MNYEAVWITGATRSGKTTRLIQQFHTWMTQPEGQTNGGTEAQPQALGDLPSLEIPGVLVLAAIGDNRIDLVDRITLATAGKYPVHSTTPLGFFETEVILFWPLLIQQLDLKAQFPLRLNPENEQELATQLWRAQIDRAIAQSAVNESRLVRRVLDLLQLAALAQITIAEIPAILEQGLGDKNGELPIAPQTVGEMLQQWQSWCLERGLLTYGITTGLYGQYLLPHPTYQQHLTQRYAVLLADDVDEYPAIARHLFEVLLDTGVQAAFTYNPDGAVRLGLGADPHYLEGLATRCRVEVLATPAVPCLSTELGTSVVELAGNPTFFAILPEAIQTIQTISRAQLLRRVAEVITEAVQSHQVEPQDVAVISPGLDAIARYSLSEILAKHQIPVESLNDQRPLTSSPIIRALLTLLTLVYPYLGRLVDRDAVAEMLVVLSQQPGSNRGRLNEPEGNDQANGAGSRMATRSALSPALIDPVRAGLLADYCFAPHPDRPRLLAATTFPRWDRLGYQASTAYQGIVDWLEQQQAQLEQRLIPSAVSLLDRAIQQFFLGGGALPFDQLVCLRQFMETAQHYWEISDRLRRRDRSDASSVRTISQFIQLLQSGTVTANPYPVRPIGPASNAVTLANVFQYRSSRRAHRWQFWLDAGSPRWLSGVDALFAAPLFLQSWSGRAWTTSDLMTSNEQRLRRILLDLLGRSSDKVYLCHSDLSTNGQEQTGVLLSLLNAATPLESSLSA